MNYVIYSAGMPFNGETVRTQSLGGSETAAYYLGKVLAKRGHRVVMFTDAEAEGIFDDVTYCWAGEKTEEHPLGKRFSQFATSTPCDVLVIQRHPLGFHKDYASKINILQMHDISLMRSAGAFNAGAQRIDAVTCVSQFHKEQVDTVFDIREGFTRVIPNGVDLRLYALPFGDSSFDKLDTVRAHKGLRYLYQSRPERGLGHLVSDGGIMHRLEQAGSDAHLFLCGYDHVRPEMEAYYGQLAGLAKKRSNVTMLGSLSKSELAAVQMECDALIYPTEFEEVSCISAMEAMAAGLPLISTACAALPETCADSGSILVPMKHGLVDEDAFFEALQTFGGNPEGRGAYKAAQLEAAQRYSWDAAVDKFESMVADLFAARASNPDRMARHFIEHSDIGALDAYMVEHSDANPTPIFEATHNELHDMYAFAHGGSADVAAHYDSMINDFYDELRALKKDPGDESNTIIYSTRYRGIHHLVGKAIKSIGKQNPRILEFGCAHGHIINALAKAYPDADFVGMDFKQKNIDAAAAGADKHGITNAAYACGSLEELPDLGLFDIVVAAEVVEHILDYRHALDSLRACLHNDGAGVMVLTTPIGRWEWIGTEKWHQKRQHLHHFERDDLLDLFSVHNPEILFSASGVDPAAGVIGSWVYSVRPDPAVAFGRVNYERKFKETAPRDTLTLGMIVHNAQDSIGQSLRSVMRYVDEVVIRVDPKTTDKTYARIAEVAMDWPLVRWDVQQGESPLDIGFDEARNAVLDKATGDWFLWMDADELMVGAQNMWRCLRPGAFNGFAMAQHHMSQDPAACLSTDYPTRLFRKSCGARFYGVVHEHPEVEIGLSIPHTQQLHDLRLVHYGYTDENTRRGRYDRNFPLLLRDLEKYPDRPLNKFLYVRDLSQSIAFEGEQIGTVSAGMVEKAKIVTESFNKLIDAKHLRMTLDALPYYSTAAAVLGGGFKAKIQIETDKPEIMGLKGAVNVEGHFHNRKTYRRLLARISEETTAKYEERYL